MTFKKNEKTDPSLTDATLVKRACLGEKLAQEELVRLFYEPIFRLVFYRVKTRLDAEDVTQEIFIKVLNKLSKLKEPEKFKPWLYTLAINQVKDFYKKKKLLFFFGGSTELEMLENCPKQGSSSAASADFHNLLTSFLDTLSKTQQEIFLLKYVDDLTIVEIASVLKKNESTVKTHLYRSLKKLKANQLLGQKLLKEANDVNG